MIENIVKAWGLADAIDRREGALAYARYNILMRKLAYRFDTTLQCAAGVFCALSPNSDYASNLRSAVTVLDAHQRGIEHDRVTVAAYGHCKRRAFDYAAGLDFLSKAKGLKIRSFYINVTEPLTPGVVTIDGHMFNLYEGQKRTLKEAIRAPKHYRRVAADFCTIADALGILANQLQGVLWFTWKRIHNVIYDPQMSLLSRGDHWKTLRDIERLKPFPFLNSSSKVKPAPQSQSVRLPGF